MVMRTALACVVALSALTACGTDTGAPPGKGEWTEQRLAQDAAGESSVGFAADGDDVLVVVPGEGGGVTSYLSTDGGDFVAGVPLEADAVAMSGRMDPVRVDGTWWVVSTGARLVDEGTRDERFVVEPRVLRSDNGLTWDQVEVSGIPAQVDITDVETADGALVAVGVKRNGVDTGGEPGFEAAAWHSDDGMAWSESALPDVVSKPSYDDESVASRLTVVDGRVLAGGRLGRHSALWSSTDAGATWTRVESPEIRSLYEVYGLASQGSTVLVSGPVVGEERGRLLRSDDGGRTFRPTGDQPTEDAEMGSAGVWAGGGRFFTFTEQSGEDQGGVEVCYADLDACLDPAHSDVGYIFASDDGEEWPIIDTSGLGVGDEFAGVVGTDDGRVVMMHADGKGLLVHSWTAGAPLPQGEPLRPPERAELVQVGEGEDPEPGVRYHAPIYTHCNMEWLFLGDTPWQRTDDGPDERSDEARGWPMAGETILGYATLRDDGVVEYSIGEGEDAEVIATYEQTGVEPPGCA